MSAHSNEFGGSRLRRRRLATYPQYLTRLDAAATHVYTNQLARSKVSLQLTRELSLRAIGDYSDVSAAPALTSIESRRRMTADVLATYQVNPFTALYLGYTSVLDDIGQIDPEALGGVRRFGLPIVSRQLFAKLSYGIRF
jgi:hypothetical protein